MKLHNVLVVYYVHNYQSLEIVQHCLKRHGIKYSCVSRSKATKKLITGKDLIITVGGDGTFLRTSHLVGNTPMLVVSSDVSKNEGFFSQASKDDFEKKFKRVLAGKFTIVALPRLEAVINRKVRLHPAVNEVFIGSARPYHTSLYTLHIGSRREFQKSSGVLIYTGAGSHAWAASAGCRRRKIEDSNFYFLVREPYKGRLTRPQLVHGVLRPNQKLIIHSDIHDGIAVSDSEFEERKFRDGDTIEISVSKQPVNYVAF